MRWLLFSLLFYLVGSVPVLAANEIAFFTVDVKLKGTGLEALDVNFRCDFDQPLSLDFRIPIDDSRTFTVPIPAEGGRSCVLTTGSLPAHTLRYLGDGGSIFDEEAEGCRFTGIERGHSNFCQIQVESQETSLTVYKHWVGTSEPEPDVRAMLDCGQGGRYEVKRINLRKSATWSLVITSADGLTCSVSEPESEDYMADTSDCQDLVILAGAEEECTIVNTKVVKMIEALNRYGLVVMILVFMVVGGFAARRFV
jgi:hypothetical protein